MPTRGIPWPAGDPALDPGGERDWRERLVRTALTAVSTAVHEPTVFEVADHD